MLTAIERDQLARHGASIQNKKHGLRDFVRRRAMA
jgi:hypothetical protein